MVVVRHPIVADAANVACAWEDARRLYSDMDHRVFLPPDPTDHGLGRALVDGLMAASERPDRWVRIAEVDRQAVGFVTATLHEPSSDAHRDIMRDATRRHVKIDTLVVQRSHWRRGVGRALIEGVEGWAREVEASLLKVGTYAHSPGAVAFYEALGYGHRAIVFEKFMD